MLRHESRGRFLSGGAVVDKISLIGFFVVFVGLALALARSRPVLRKLVAPVAALGLAGGGQWLMLGGRFVEGGLLYAAAVIVLVAWIRVERLDVRALVSGHEWTLRREAIAAAGVIGLTILLRAWRIGDIPFGIEQDEGLWTWEIAHQFFSDLRPVFTTFHYESFPVGFFQGAIFLKVFGLSMTSVRIEMLLFNVVASVLFYLLVRRLISVPVALIATFFLALSVLDISAGRIAVFESKIKFWVILTLFLFYWGVRKDSLGLYLLTGATLAGGLLAYQTFYMTPIIVASSAMLVAARQPRRWRRHILKAVALAAPLVAALPSVRKLSVENNEHNTGEWSLFIEAHPYDSFFEKVFRSFHFAGENFGEMAHTVFFQQRWEDFLIVRTDAPIVLAAILPFFILGLAIACLRVRQFEYQLMLLWFLVDFLIAPMATGANFARVFYPGLPAVFILAGIGGVFVFTAIQQNLERVPARAFAVATGAFALLLIAVSWQVYFNELADPVDRQMRREMLDLAGVGAAASQMVLVPYIPADDAARRFLDGRDAVVAEVDGIRFAVGGQVGLSNAEEHYKLVPYHELLSSVWEEHAGGALAILYAPEERDRGTRDAFRAVVEQCLPQDLVQGQFYKLALMSTAQLDAGRCYSVPPPVILTPAGYWPAFSAEPLVFRWGLSSAQEGWTLRIERDDSPAGAQVPDWQNVYASEESGSTSAAFEASGGLWQCEVCTDGGLAPGRYRWQVEIFDGDRLVDARGNRGVESEWTGIVVAARCADADGNGQVNQLDISIFGRNAGPAAPDSPYDLNADGVVDEADVLLVGAMFGFYC